MHERCLYEVQHQSNLNKKRISLNMYLSVYISGFSYFDQILLSLFNISNTFHDCMWVVYHV